MNFFFLLSFQLYLCEFFFFILFKKNIRVKRNILCCVVSHSKVQSMCWVILYMVSHWIVERMHKSGINYKKQKAKDKRAELRNAQKYILTTTTKKKEPHTLPSHSFTSKTEKFLSHTFSPRWCLYSWRKEQNIYNKMECINCVTVSFFSLFIFLNFFVPSLFRIFIHSFNLMDTWNSSSRRSYKNVRLHSLFTVAFWMLNAQKITHTQKMKLKRNMKNYWPSR